MLAVAAAGPALPGGASRCRVVATVRVPGTSFIVADHSAGKVYTSSPFDDVVSVISMRAHKVLATIHVAGSAWLMAADPPAGKVYVASSKGVTAIDTRTNKVTGFAKVPSPYSVAAYPAGHEIYVSSGFQGSGPGKVYVISTRTGKVVATVPVGQGIGEILADARDGRIYVTLSSSGPGVPGRVAVINPKTNKTIHQVAVPGDRYPFAMALDPENHSLYIIGDAGRVAVLSTATNAMTANLGPRHAVAEAIEPSAGKLFVSTEVHTISVTNVRTGKIIATVPISRGGGAGIATDHSTGTVYAVGDGRTGALTVINARTDQVIATVPISKYTFSIAVDQQTNTAYAAGRNSVTIISSCR